MFSFPMDLFFDTRSVATKKNVEKDCVKLRPATYIEDRENAFVAELLMPGLDSGSLKVKVVDEELHIEGERTSTLRKQWHGKLSEKIALTQDIDVDAIEANYKDGLLSVTMPKKTKAKKVKEITIC